MHLALWYVVLVRHQYHVCKNYVGSVYVGGYDGLSESGLCVFRELYELTLSMSLLGFGMGTMLVNFHMCGNMLVLRAVFNLLVRNTSSIGPICFMCLILVCQDLASCYFYFF